MFIWSFQNCKQNYSKKTPEEAINDNIRIAVKIHIYLGSGSWAHGHLIFYHMSIVRFTQAVTVQSSLKIRLRRCTSSGV